MHRFGQIICGSIAFCFVHSLNAAHEMQPISFLSHVGTGTFYGEYDDLTWFRFAANAGDQITISGRMWDPLGPLENQITLYRALGDGVVNVGDSAEGVDPGLRNIGLDYGPNPAAGPFDTLISHLVVTTGEYAIQLYSYQNIRVRPASYEVSILGSTAVQPLPESGSAALLLGSALFALIVLRAAVKKVSAR
jgi:hypothetical protein